MTCRILQEKHARETGDIKLELEKQKTLLEEKERERQDLERKLEDRMRENENLRRAKHNLQDTLQRTQDENVHLQHRLKQTDLNYALPPFLAGSRSTRNGWHPKTFRR